MFLSAQMSLRAPITIGGAASFIGGKTKAGVRMGTLIHAEECFLVRRILNDFYRDLDERTEQVTGDEHKVRKLSESRPPKELDTHLSNCDRCFNFERGLDRKHHTKWNMRPSDST